MNSAPEALRQLPVSSDEKACEQYLVPLYADLRRMAARFLRRERKNSSVAPTGLVHDAVVRLLGLHSIVFESKDHFLGLAAGQMRRILVEHARRRMALKRRPPEEQAGWNASQGLGLEEMLAVEHLMDGLQAVDARAYAVTHPHFYLGLSFAEEAASLGISEKTAFRDWEYARAWLYDKTTRGAGRGWRRSTRNAILHGVGGRRVGGGARAGGATAGSAGEAG
jgi:RNA polymerase sigma-70 factor (ECF subfamily)